MEILVDPALEGFLSASMRLALPIMLAALGGIFNERAGVLNIGMEGMMLGGALSAFVVTYYAGSTALGIVGALILGALFGLIIGYFTITLAGDQVIVGIAFNLLMLGVTSFVYRAFFAVGTQRPQVEGLSTLPIPILESIPIIGPLFFRQNPLAYIAYLPVGESPESAETLGIHINRTRYAALILCGMLCGLGGAFISIGSSSIFVDNMTAGRGYIALALLVLGRRHPVGVFGASLLFGVADALQLRAQILDIQLPFQFMLMLPYLLTIIVLAVFVRRTNDPAALGKHYQRGRKDS
ncbi:MAG: ABC transporter permease [Chloroflexi bacterium]|uniref:ABC transporter permease n=1 Tax=Candidatus Flexifilum breve TaxID=3140694 RepID=UPI0031361AE8|nr:ABC transporter permease [Chloroflexota bacterium]